MKRWHSETTLMYSRWREELRKHAAADASGVAVVSSDCHCLRGIGFMRKRRPHDCGNPRCGLCHNGKVFGPKARATKRRQAIAFELEAAGEVA